MKTRSRLEIAVALAGIALTTVLRAADVPAGSELLIQGSNANGHLNQQLEGFGNFGTVRLESVNGGWTSGLTITSGLLTNELSGEVVVNPGSGGGRFIRGGLWNRGLVSVNYGVELGGADGWFRNEAAWNVAEGQAVTLNGAGTRFEQVAGTVQLNGGFVAEGTRFHFSGGAVKGNYVYLDGGVLELGPDADEEGKFILTRSTSQLLGDIGPLTEVWVRGDNRGGHTQASSPLGFANEGTLRLESANGGWTSSFRVDGGPLTNRAAGKIVSRGGAGGGRQLLAELRNEGLLSLEYGLGLGFANARHVNRGTVDIAGGSSLVLDGGAQVFRQEAGGLNILGGFDGSGITFEFAGGSITGGAYLDGSRLAVEPTATGPGYFYLTRSSSSLGGSLQAGQTVQVRGDNRGGHTQISVEPGFVSRGTVKLESANGGYTSSLGLDEGSFRNGTGGLVAINPGAGGARGFVAELFNEGTFEVNHHANLGRANAHHTNRGSFNISEGVGLTLNQPGQVFRQEAGTINALGGFDASGIRFEFAGGSVNGTLYLDGSTLNLAPGNQGAGSFILTRSSSRLEGLLNSGQTVQVRGDNRGGHTQIEVAPDFANRGTLRLASANGGYNTSLRLASGALRNLAGGRLLVEPGAGGGRSLITELRNDGEVVLATHSNLGRPDAVHVNRGTFTLAEGIGLSISGQNQTFRQEAGRLDLLGGADISAIRFDYLGGLIAGTPYLDGCTLFVAPENLASGSFMVTRSSTVLAGELHAGQSVQVRGDNRGGHTEITLAPEFVNRGTLRLESANGGYVSSVVKPEGVLSNLVGGVILAQPGAGGPRNVRAQLLNEGTVLANQPLGLGLAAGDVQVNRGRIEVPEGSSLGFTTTGQTFRQEGGVLQVRGGFSGQGMRFEYLGGLFDGGAYFDGSTLLFGPGAGPAGSFTVTRSSTRLIGDIPAGVSVTVSGNNQGGHTTVVAEEGFANAGTLRFVSSNGGYHTSLAVTEGQLRNRFGGVIEVLPGASGPRNLVTPLINEGELRVNYGVTIGRGGEGILNTGIINVAADQTLTVAGPLLQSDGALTGTGAIAGEVNVTGGRIAPGVSPGVLTLQGNLKLGGRGVLDLELGGTEVGTGYDRLQVNGAAEVSGVVRVRLINGHQPAAGNRYDLVTAGSLTFLGRLELPQLPESLGWTVRSTGGLQLEVISVPVPDTVITGRVLGPDTQPVAGAAVYAAQGVAEGLLAEFWNNRAGEGEPAARRLDPSVNYNWGGGAPFAGFQPDNFFVRWSGTLKPAFSETYTFHTVSDDGVRLWIGDQQLIDNWGDHGPTENSGQIELVAGQTYSVRLEFYENGGGAVIQLNWSSPSLPREVIAGSALQPPTGTPPTTRSYLTTVTAADGRYRLPVAAGTWTVGLSGLADLGFDPAAEQVLNVPAAGAAANFTLAPLTVPRFPDLTVANVTVPPTGLAGLPLAVEWDSVNQGDAPAAPEWTEVVYLATHPSGFDARELGRLTVTQSLASGASVRRQLEVTLPRNLTGNFYVLVRADTALQVDEGTREANNSAAAPQPVNLLIGDLVVESVTSAGEVKFGESLDVIWVVRNTGGAPVGLPWRDRVYFSSSAAGGGITLATSNAPVALAPGESYTNHAVVTLPLAGQNVPGSYFFLVRADVNGEQLEANEGNNLGASAAVNVLAPPPPDLVVTEIRVPTLALLGQPVPLVWTVRNAGLTRAVAPWKERLQLATDAAGANAFTLLTVDVGQPLEPGAEITRTNTVILPASQVGERFLLVTADVDDQVAESGDAANNTRATETVFTIAAPNLVTESLTVPPAGVLGQDIQISWRVRNAGNTAAVGSWNDRLVLHLPTGPVTLLTQSAADQAPLAPGATYARTATARLPLLASLPAGAYGVSVQTDANGDVGESNEADNLRDTGGQPLAVTLPPLPELTVSRVLVPETALAGAEVDLVWTVTNLGAAEALGSWQESLALSADNVAGGDTPLATLEVSGPLAAGASVTRTNRVRFPLSLAGHWWLVATTDAAAQLVEGNEANNTAVSTNSVGLPLKLSLELSALTVTEAQTPAVLRGRLFRSGPVNEALAVVLTSGNPGELTAPESVTIPAGAPVMDVNFGIVADGVVDGSKTVVLTARAATDTNYVEARVTVTVVDVDQPRLQLALAAPNVLEGLTVGATVSRPAADPLQLDVAVLSSNPDVLVPDSVIIPAGASNVTFAVIALDDARLDLARTAEIRVTAANHLPAAVPLQVDDNDNPGLSVVVEPATFSEAGGGLAAQGIVTRTNVTPRPQVVQLRVNDSSEAVVVPSVVIPGGKASAEFYVSAVNDNLNDGPQTVQLSAFVADTGTGVVYAEATPASFTVTDDDGPSLRLTLGGSLAREGRNPALTGVIARNSDPAAALLVELASSDVTEATVPASVEIPAGQTSTTFPVTTLNDGTVDGNQRVTLNATAAGHAAAAATLTVTDGDLPDLVVSEVTAPETGLTREIFQVGYRITNQGFDTATGATIQKVILSQDPVLDASDPVLDETPFPGPLPAGESFSRTLTLFVPRETGNWWVFVVTDTANAIRETLEENNTGIAAKPLRVNPAYAATVETDVTTAPAGTPVPLRGRAVRPDNSPAVGELVNLHVVVNGARRLVTALTDQAGNFTAVFQPLPGEAGSYTVGAAHPGVDEALVQDRFSLLGLRVEPNYARQTVLPGTVARSEFELVNLSSQPLTGITAKSGAVEGLTVQIEAPAQLPAGGRAKVTVLSSVPEPRDAAGRFVVQLISEEGARADLTIDYNVELPQPRLVATPRALELGMVRDRQTLVEFDVVNTGGAATGPLNVTVPEIPWLRVISATPLGSLGPGERLRVGLQLSPDATVPLQVFEGRIAVHNSDVGVAVPFTFRHVSEARGAVAVKVEDEKTYYGDGARVAGAQVVLRDVYTSEAKFTGVTDTNGLVQFADVPEGTYNLDATAPKHDNFLQTVQVGPGRTNEFTAFLRTQLVRYNWKVEEIDIEERATIRLETIFETTVPAPVVTIEPNSIDLTGVEGDEYQIELKLTNQGLIAAQDVKLKFADGSKWSVHPLTEDVGVLPAKSSLTVPVIFRRIDQAGPVSARHGVGRHAGSADGCRPPTVGFDWQLICGPFGVAYWAPVPVIDLGLCPPPPLTIARDPFFFLDPIPAPPYSGGGPGGRGYAVDIGWGNRGFASYSGTNDCSCLKGGFVDKCVAGEAGFKGELSGFAEELVNSALASLAYTRLLGVEVKLSGAGKLCTCCEEVDGQGVVGLKAEGSLSAQIEAKIFFGPSVKFEKEVSVSGLSEAKAEIFGGGGVELATTGYATLKASTECLLQNPEICIEGGISSKLFAGIKGSGKVSGKDANGREVSASLEGQIGVEGGFSARAKVCTKDGQTTTSRNVCRDAIVAKAALTVSLEAKVGDGSASGFVGGSISAEQELLAADCPGENASLAVAPAESDAAMVARWFGHASPTALVSAVTPQSPLVNSLSSNASGRDLSDALLAGLPARSARAESAGTVVFERSAEPADAAAWREAEARAARAARPRKAAGNNGVCAQVRLQIEQEAVVTRKAIGATLEITNESEDTPLENIGVTINIYDGDGNLANERFIVLAPELTRLQPMAVPATNRYVLGGAPLQLAAATVGSARWVILPRDDAAPETVQQYYVGGLLAYTAGGVPGTAELTPGVVRVYPNAKLALKYFHQRDVFSDDPFTDKLEPSLPFVLGVMVHNQGKGLARNMSITSGQPKIVENVKGLLIDFSIIGTEVAGKSVTPSLSAQFGDINPGDTAIGRWLLKSTLQGLFIDYQATLEHDDRFGERGASVFESVEIHELIHQVEAQGSFADNKPDFLVNDLKDDEDLPDTVHLSDATTAPVAVVRAGGPDGEPTADDLEVQLTTPMPAGFAYLRIADPANGRFRLAGVKRSDGRVLPVGLNAWVTDRTFLGMGKRPRYENVLHLFDHDSTGSYTLIYARDEAVPDLAPPSSRVATLPANSPALIPVSWTGEDDPFGTGVGAFDVFVSINGGPFTRWLENTRSRSGLYPGAAGRSYAFYSRARDLAGNVEAAPLAPQATTFTIGNSAPGVDPIPPVALDEGGALDLTVTAADADIPADALAFSLVNAPTGMQINATTGRLTWQTGENDGPRTHNVTVRVTDNGEPPLSGDATLSVTVRELNQAPALPAPAEALAVNEGELLSFTFAATDPDLPAQPLRYRLGTDAPAGATINAVTGELRWVPAETLGGSSASFAVIVGDSQSPELTATNRVVVQIADINSPPTLEPIADRVIWEGDLLSIQAVADDLDVPEQTLAFALEPGAPAGAAVGAATGLFTWTPAEAEVPSTNHITLTVSDNAPVPLSASQTFKVTARALKPGLNRPQRFANGDLSFRFKGTQGRRYVLEGSPNFTNWVPLREFVAEQAIFTITDQTSAEFPIRYFRARPVE